MTTMAVSTSEVWRNRVGGIALVVFGLWAIVSGELLPFPTRQRIQGVPAMLIGGIVVLIGGVILGQNLPERKDDDEEQDDE